MRVFAITGKLYLAFKNGDGSFSIFNFNTENRAAHGGNSGGRFYFELGRWPQRFYDANENFAGREMKLALVGLPRHIVKTFLDDDFSGRHDFPTRAVSPLKLGQAGFP